MRISVSEPTIPDSRHRHRAGRDAVTQTPTGDITSPRAPSRAQGDREAFMNTQEHIRVVLDAFDAVERRDRARLDALYHPDVEFHWPPSLLDAWGNARMESWDEVQPTKAERRMDPRVLAAGEDVVVQWHWRARGRHGRLLDAPVLGVYRVRDGRLASARMFFFDAASVLDFLKGERRARAGRQAISAWSRDSFAQSGSAMPRASCPATRPTWSSGRSPACRTAASMSAARAPDAMPRGSRGAGTAFRARRISSSIHDSSRATERSSRSGDSARRAQQNVSTWQPSESIAFATRTSSNRACRTSTFCASWVSWPARRACRSPKHRPCQNH
jgi:uncharacterized protein